MTRDSPTSCSCPAGRLACRYRVLENSRVYESYSFQRETVTMDRPIPNWFARGRLVG